ncbi:MAG TPA: DUF4258 domain-containing protein [Candidatus Nanoarchaeia archaeon]|nr:DUF4258 domain-containing protein [Candidatus Nanoarchaeia archaeon]
MRLKIGKHAKERMILRGVTKEQIKICIQRGATVRQTDGMLSSYTYLEVAWKKLEEDYYFIKTVKIKG